VRAFQLLDQVRVVGHARDDGHVLKVLCRRAHHRRSADIDVLDQVPDRNARLGGGGLECVEIHNHHIDWLDTMLFDCGPVGLVAADVQDAAVDFGVQGLHAAVEHFREAGQAGYVADGEARLAQRARRAAGRDQLHPIRGELLGKGDQPGFVGDAQQRTLNLLKTAQIENSLP
jgi:hypothetical protein